MLIALHYRDRVLVFGAAERLHRLRDRHSDLNLNSASIADGHTITDEHANRHGATSIRCRARLPKRRKCYL